MTTCFELSITSLAFVSLESLPQKFFERYPILKKYKFSVDTHEDTICIWLDPANLLSFQKEVGEPIIIDGNSIEIYDSWRE